METNNNTLDNINLRSEDVQEILTTPPHWMVRWGNTLFFAILVIILIMSYIIKYPEFINAPIIISSQNPPEKIEARISSKIEKILIQDQQKVQKGDILVVLQSTANYQDILELKDIVNSINTNDLVNFPLSKTSQFRLGELQGDYNNFAKALTDEILFTNLKPYAPEDIAISQNISENKNQLNILKQQLNLETAKYSLTKKNYERSSLLFEQGVISKVEFENEKLKFLQAQQSIEGIKITISQLEDGAKNLQKTKKNVNINSVKDKTNYSAQSLYLLEQLRKSIIQWEQNYLLTSSTDGIVSFQNFLGINQHISAGENIISIMPNEKEGIIGRMNIPSTNSGKIAIGNKVLVKLDNYRYQEFGIIEGQVKNISLIPDKDGNYYAYIILPKGLKTSYNKDIIFDKEMKGSADIVTQDLRLIERFFYQIRKLLGYQT